MSRRITASRRDDLLAMARYEFLKRLARERDHWLQKDMPNSAALVTEDIEDFEQVFSELTHKLPGDE